MVTSVHNVVLALTNGMPIFEAAVPCEVFGVDRSDLVCPWYRLSVVGFGDGPVRLGPGFHVPLTGDADDVLHADTVIVPACANVHDDPPAQLVTAVRAAHENGARLISICSGAFILAAAGILDGRRATTHWMHAAELARRYPAVQVNASVLYVDEGDIVTSAGTAAGLDACLHVVRLDHGAAVAAEVARRIVTSPHRQGGQAQYDRGPMGTDDDWLAPLLDWANTRLGAPLTVADLAIRAGVSIRTLERRFTHSIGKAPLRWLLLQRVRQAQEMLETTNMPIEAVAAANGFGTASNMRAHFKKHTGIPPATYRRTFQEPVCRSAPRP